PAAPGQPLRAGAADQFVPPVDLRDQLEPPAGAGIDVRGQPGQLRLELGEGELSKLAVLFGDNTHVGRLDNRSDVATFAVHAGRELTWHGVGNRAILREDERAPDRHRHVPLHRHRGLDEAAARARRRLRRRAGRAPPRPAGSLRTPRRRRGGYPGRRLLRWFVRVKDALARPLRSSREGDQLGLVAEERAPTGCGLDPQAGTAGRRVAAYP